MSALPCLTSWHGVMPPNPGSGSDRNHAYATNSDPTSASTRRSISSICLRRVCVLGARMRATLDKASRASPNVPAISVFVVLSSRATKSGEKPMLLSANRCSSMLNNASINRICVMICESSGSGNPIARHASFGSRQDPGSRGRSRARRTALKHTAHDQ